MFNIEHTSTREDGFGYPSRAITVSVGYDTFSGAMSAAGYIARKWAKEAGFGAKAVKTPTGWTTVHRSGAGRKARLFNVWTVVLAPPPE